MTDITTNEPDARAIFELAKAFRDAATLLEKEQAAKTVYSHLPAA